MWRLVGDSNIADQLDSLARLLVFDDAKDAHALDHLDQTLEAFRVVDKDAVMVFERSRVIQREMSRHAVVLGGRWQPGVGAVEELRVEMEMNLVQIALEHLLGGMKSDAEELIIGVTEHAHVGDSAAFDPDAAVLKAMNHKEEISLSSSK